MANANQYQVGGDHYKAIYQHWDFCEDIGLGYLESVATKYLLPSRQAKKGGMEDLKKSIHYIEKLIEVERPNRVYFMDKEKVPYPDDRENVYKQANLCLSKMCDQALCPACEKDIIEAIMNWEIEEDLHAIKTMIEDLIEINYGNLAIDPVDPESLSDDNGRGL